MRYFQKELGDYIDILSGFAFKTKDFSESGIPIIKIKNIDPPSVTLENLTFVSKNVAEKQKRFVLQYDDVLIAMTGSHINQWASVVGRVARVKYHEKTLLNQRVGKVVVKENAEADLNFIYYFLSQDRVKIELAAKAGGAANQANISPAQIKALMFPCPPLAVQKRIASILSAYDELIENNKKQIKLLEEAAQRLYKEWFIDLHFPGHESTQIIDGLPTGWMANSLDKIGCRLESGSRPKGGIDSSIKNGVPSIGAENVIGLGEYNYSSEKLISHEFYRMQKRGKLQDRDILIYKDGAYIGRTSLFQDGFPYYTASVNEHVFLLHMQDEALQYYVFFTLYQKEYFDKMQKLNTNAAQPGINSKSLLSLQLIIPTEDLIKKFNSFVTPVMQSIFSKAKQNKELQQARERLLPKLMSGEIEV